MTNFRTAKYDTQSLQIDDPNFVRQQPTYDPVLEILTQEGVNITVGGGASVAFVQTVVNNAISYCLDRRNHTFADPAASIILTDGRTQQAFDDAVSVALTQLGGITVPGITGVPGAYTGSVSVGSNLTTPNPPGTWSGSPVAYDYVDYRINQVTGALIPTGAVGIGIAAATPFVAPITALDLTDANGVTYKKTYSVVAINAAGGRSPPIFATPTAVITGTKPVNTPTLPTIGGSTAQGSQLTYDLKSWTGSPTTFGIQVYDNNVPFGSRVTVSALTGNLPNTASIQASHVIDYDVIGYTALGVASLVYRSSNSITVAGAAPAVANVSVPVWANPLQFGTRNDFTPGDWGTSPISSIRGWEFLLQVAATGPVGTTSYTGAVNTVAQHTPRVPAASGDALQIKETVYAPGATIDGNGLIVGTAVGSAVSILKTITAASTALSTTLAQDNINWTVGQPISAVTPVTAAGGTDPKTFVTVPALSGYGLVQNPTNGQITGTPTTQAGATTFRTTVTDSAGSPASSFKDWNATISAAGVTPASVIGYPIPTAFDPYSYGNYDGSSSLTFGGNLELSVVQDPRGSGLPMYLRTIYRSVWFNGGSQRNHRNEELAIDHGQPVLIGSESWTSFAFIPKVGAWPITVGALGDEEMIVEQTHSQSSGDTQPDIALYHIQETGQFQFRRSWSTQVPSAASGGNGPGWNQTKEGQVTEYAFTAAAGTLIKYVRRWRPGWLTAHAPILQIWLSLNGGPYTLVVNRTAATDYNTYNYIGAGGSALFPGSYYRTGFYKWSGTGWSSNYSTIAAYYSSIYYASGTNKYDNMVAAIAGYV